MVARAAEGMGLAVSDGGSLLGMWRRSADLRDPVGTAQDRHSLGYQLRSQSHDKGAGLSVG